MNENRIKLEIESFRAAMLPFGYLDLERAIEVSLEAGHDGDWLAEEVTNFINDTGIKLEDVDIVYIVYNSILQISRNEINDWTQKDIWNDLDSIVEVYGNYMCTSFDGTEKAVKDTLKLAYRVPKNERSENLQWFISELKNMY